MRVDPAEQLGRPFEQLRSEHFATFGVVGGLLGAALGGLDIAGRRTAYPSD